MYLDKLDIMGFEVGKKYSLLNNKNIFQLNININPKERKKILDREITLYDIKNKEVMDKNKKIFVRNLVNYKRLYYNKSIKNNFENLFLVALTSNSYTDYII